MSAHAPGTTLHDPASMLVEAQWLRQQSSSPQSVLQLCRTSPLIEGRVNHPH
jgi:hypothetical protein